MARVISEFPENIETRGRPFKYPWRDWLNGEAWELVPGVDFNVEVASFRATLMKRAKDFGLTVRTAQSLDENDEPVFFLQATE